MSKKVLLKSLFESDKGKLEEQLAGAKLPQDANKVQQIIAEYLNELCDSNGEFRQSLTQSEDYVLQAAMSLHNAQQELYNVLIQNVLTQSQDGNNTEAFDGFSEKEATPSEKANHDVLNTKLTSTQAVIGSAGGALVGKLLFNGWGAVFGAIAGSACALFLASRNDSNTKNGNGSASTTNPSKSQNDINEGIPIEVGEFISIVSAICDRVDQLVETYRAQINRVINKYESQEKPTLEMNYRSLMENIQLLVGYSRTHGDEEKFVKKIRERVDDLAETLENYQLVMADYTEEHSAWFERVVSPNTTELRMVYPAIVKGNEVILKGKVFVPKN